MEVWASMPSNRDLQFKLIIRRKTTVLGEPSQLFAPRPRDPEPQLLKSIRRSC